jgi:hypothetical protein
MVNRHTRTRTTLAWVLWLATFGCCAGGLLVTLALTRPLTIGVLAEGAAFALAFPLGFATVGLLVTLRRPANPIGWLYAAAGVAWSWTIPFDPWIEQLLREHRPLPPAAQFAIVVGDYSWAPAIALGVTLPALLLPDGRLKSRRWRVVVATSVVGATLAVLAGSLTPSPLESTPIDNPFGLAGMAGTMATVVGAVDVALHWGSLPAAAVCVLLRFRASRGVERQQMRWVAAGAAGAVAGLLLTLPGFSGSCPGRRPPGPGRRQPGCGRRQPGCCSRLRPAAPPGPGPGRPVLQPPPLRRRPHLEAFAVRLRDQVDLDALEAELLAVVDQTVSPTQASVWLRPAALPRLRAPAQT